jgi:hypothetical protein
MSNSLEPALVIASYAAAAAIFAYAAYWAFDIRRALVGRIYRSQVLWLGVVSIVLFAAVVPTPTTNSVTTIILSNLPVIALALVLFAFVDSTVPVARRSDPLLRNILHWGRFRFAAWTALVLVEIYGAYGEITSSNTGSSVVLGLLLLTVIGAPPMLIGARRSTSPNLRGTLKWFGLGLLATLGLPLVTIAEVLVGVPSTVGPLAYAQIPYNAVAMLFGYAMYRSVRSLAPINRLQANEPAAISAADIRMS